LAERAAALATVIAPTMKLEPAMTVATALAQQPEEPEHWE
jgi:hypothetical protein